eukprot:9270471-Alexandrium_andersonii.AAC.1
MPDVSMAHARMVAGQRGMASGSRAPACCVSQWARSLVASDAPSTPKSCSARVAACRLVAEGAGGGGSGAVRPVRQSRIHARRSRQRA